MSTRLVNVVVDARDHAALSRFWADALGWPVTFEEPDEVCLTMPGSELDLIFGPVPEPKTTKNRLHLDLATWSTDHQVDLVDRLRQLGATPVDVGQGDVPWVVLADPEGNELCVLEPREQYRDTGSLAAVVLDCIDPSDLAPFWVAATGWRLLEESRAYATLRSPDGNGPFLELVQVDNAKQGKNRVHLDVRPFADDDQAAEVERLRRLGATPIDVGQGDVRWVVLADPEGNELCVLSPGASPIAGAG